MQPLGFHGNTEFTIIFLFREFLFKNLIDRKLGLKLVFILDSLSYVKIVIN